MPPDHVTEAETIPDPGKICDICGVNVHKGIHIRIDNEYGSRCVDIVDLAERVKKLEEKWPKIEW